MMSWERCPRQWYLQNRLGVRGPVRPRQILGVIAEEALTGLIMEQPPEAGEPDLPLHSRWATWSRVAHPSEAELPTEASAAVRGPMAALAAAPKASAAGLADADAWLEWMEAKLPAVLAELDRRGQVAWSLAPAHAEGRSWDGEMVEAAERVLRGGLALLHEELVACLAADGGPTLERWRATGDPAPIPAPAWTASPVSPPGTAALPAGLSVPEGTAGVAWRATGEPPSIEEAWAIVRPWVKDPRIGWAQRLHHPERWAGGELDLVLRWRGEATLVDLKASNGMSGYSAGTEPQLQFYGWLWEAIRAAGEVEVLHGGNGRPHAERSLLPVAGIEGWYLDGPHRAAFDWKGPEGIQPDPVAIWAAMQDVDAGVVVPPAQPTPLRSYGAGGVALPLEDEAEASEAQCRSCGAAGFCDARPEEERLANLAPLIPDRWRGDQLDELVAWLAPRSGSEAIETLVGRVHVRGRIESRWGPFPNSIGEPVHGAVLVAGGGTQLLVEEAWEGAVPELATVEPGEVAILGALPAEWRGRARLTLDRHSEVVSLEDDPDAVLEARGRPTFTPLGLLRTKASVDGLVIATQRREGIAASGRPWSMRTMALWDGTDHAEVVAFGSATTQQLESIIVGDRLLVQHASLGWFSGRPQLRVDGARTRVEITRREASDQERPQGAS